MPFSLFSGAANSSASEPSNPEAVALSESLSDCTSSASFLFAADDEAAFFLVVVVVRGAALLRLARVGACSVSTATAQQRAARDALGWAPASPPSLYNGSATQV
jgi:hypothetical protein